MTHLWQEELDEDSEFIRIEKNSGSPNSVAELSSAQFQMTMKDSGSTQSRWRRIPAQRLARPTYGRTTKAYQRGSEALLLLHRPRSRNAQWYDRIGTWMLIESDMLVAMEHIDARRVWSVPMRWACPDPIPGTTWMYKLPGVRSGRRTSGDLGLITCCGADCRTSARKAKVSSRTAVLRRGAAQPSQVQRLGGGAERADDRRVRQRQPSGGLPQQLRSLQRLQRSD
jgi:hypothetical protein